MKKRKPHDSRKNENGRLREESDFEKEMSDDGVKPLPPSGRKTNTTKTKTTPGQEQRRHDAETEIEQNCLRDHLESESRVSPDAEFDWRRDGLQTKVANHFRKGRYKSECQIDLHGNTIKEAHALIWKFLQDAIGRGFRNVTIIHGRGVTSKPAAQMKSYVGQVLKEHKDVYGFCTAEPEDGGKGATWVWLRKSDDEKLETAERISARKR